MNCLRLAARLSGRFYPLRRELLRSILPRPDLSKSVFSVRKRNTAGKAWNNGYRLCYISRCCPTRSRILGFLLELPGIGLD